MNNKTIRISELKLKAGELTARDNGKLYQPGDTAENIFTSEALGDLAGKEIRSQIVPFYCNNNRFYPDETNHRPIPHPSWKNLRLGDRCQYQGRNMVVIEHLVEDDLDELYLLPEGLIMFHDLHTKSELLQKHGEWMAEHMEKTAPETETWGQCEALQAMLMMYSIGSIAIEHTEPIALATTQWFSGQEGCRWDLFSSIDLEDGKQISIFIQSGQIDCEN